MSKLDSFFQKAFSDALSDYLNFNNSRIRQPYLPTTKTLRTPEEFDEELNRVLAYSAEPRKYAQDLVSVYGLDMIGDDAEDLFKDYIKYNDPNRRPRNPNSLEDILILQSLGNPPSAETLEEVYPRHLLEKLPLSRYKHLRDSLPSIKNFDATLPDDIRTTPDWEDLVAFKGGEPYDDTQESMDDYVGSNRYEQDINDFFSNMKPPATLDTTKPAANLQNLFTTLSKVKK